MRQCLFCHRTDLTREHVWPDWISKYLFGTPKKGRFTATRTGTDRQPMGAMFKAPELNHKAKVVCGGKGGCNNNWMSALETEVQPILKPMLKGHHVTLDDYEQTVLRAWVILRTMVLEHAGGLEGSKHFYTADERRTFADDEFDGSLEPIDGSYIWLFHWRSPKWVARSNVANLSMHVTSGKPPNHLQFITGFVGEFGFQVLLGRWPKGRRLEPRHRAVVSWASALVSLWPNPATSIEWPPSGGYLSDDLYEPFCDRFIKPGFPLQRRRRRGE